MPEAGLDLVAAVGNHGAPDPKAEAEGDVGEAEPEVDVDLNKHQAEELHPREPGNTQGVRRQAGGGLSKQLLRGR